MLIYNLIIHNNINDYIINMFIVILICIIVIIYVYIYIKLSWANLRICMVTKRARQTFHGQQTDEGPVTGEPTELISDEQHWHANRGLYFRSCWIGHPNSSKIQFTVQAAILLQRAIPLVWKVVLCYWWGRYTMLLAPPRGAISKRIGTSLSLVLRVFVHPSITA